MWMVFAALSASEMKQLRKEFILFHCPAKNKIIVIIINLHLSVRWEHSIRRLISEHVMVAPKVRHCNQQLCADEGAGPDHHASLPRCYCPCHRQNLHRSSGQKRLINIRCTLVRDHKRSQGPLFQWLHPQKCFGLKLSLSQI